MSLPVGLQTNTKQEKWIIRDIRDIDNILKRYMIFLSHLLRTSLYLYHSKYISYEKNPNQSNLFFISAIYVLTIFDESLRFPSQGNRQCMIVHIQNAVYGDTRKSNSFRKETFSMWYYFLISHKFMELNVKDKESISKGQDTCSTQAAPE